MCCEGLDNIILFNIVWIRTRNIASKIASLKSLWLDIHRSMMNIPCSIISPSSDLSSVHRQNKAIISILTELFINKSFWLSIESLSNIFLQTTSSTSVTRMSGCSVSKCQWRYKTTIYHWINKVIEL